MLVLEHPARGNYRKRFIKRTTLTYLNGFVNSRVCQFKEQNSGNIINIEETSQKVLHKVQFSPHQNLQLEV
jgi:hypothetical protein